MTYLEAAYAARRALASRAGAFLRGRDLPRALAHGAGTQVLLDHRLGGLESRLQDVDGGVRLGVAAHEDIERGIAGLGPAVDADVAFRQHRHPGNAAVRREVMQVDMQQRCTRHLNAAFQRLFDVLEIVKPLGAEQVDDEMGAGVAMSISFDEVVFPVVVRTMRGLTMIFLLGGA